MNETTLECAAVFLWAMAVLVVLFSVAAFLRYRREKATKNADSKYFKRLE